MGGAVMRGIGDGSIESVYDTLPVPSRALSFEVQRRAGITCAGFARDAAELLRFLRMLGLTPDPPPPTKCGTYAGVMEHRKAGEPNCAPCRVAARKNEVVNRLRRGVIRDPTRCRECGSVFRLDHRCALGAVP